MYTIQNKRGDTALAVDNTGFVTSFTVCGREILSSPAPLFTAIIDGAALVPSSAKFEPAKNGASVSLDFGGVVITAVLEARDTCVTVEAASVPDCVFAILFGPYHVTTCEVVGEVVGVVQGGDIAAGMMALNIKTCAGSLPGFETGASADSGITTSQVSTAAAKTDGGAVFCFHTRRRDTLTYSRVGQVEKSMTYPLAKDDPDAYIPGAKLAIFGVRRGDVMQRIGELELETGLPHPYIEGEWNKTARADMRSYIISNFDTLNADTVIDAAEKAGINRIYQDGPFENWGQFKLGGGFPNGRDDMRAVVAKAAAKDMLVGVHCLTNFITTNDPFITPVPSEHLCAVGELRLTADVGESDVDIAVEYSDILKQPLTLNAVKLGTEIFTFGKYDGGRFTGVVRGAFGTKAAAHVMDETAYLLWDYPYRTLFPDIILQDEMADNLADFFIDTGVKQISFDGLEGCNYTGHGDYACDRFVTRCYDKWGADVISDGSNLHHYCWHIHNYMNWGEPWGEAMRSGQIVGRMRNQDFFRRNLFPRMFGWLLMRCAERKFPATTLEDIEWAMSMSSGYDAGFALSVGVSVLQKHGLADEILGAIKTWDELRVGGKFTEEQREKLKEIESEWHLEKSGGKYLLSPVNITKPMICDLSEMQPGQPGGSDWQVDCRYGGAVKFILRITGEDCAVSQPMFMTPCGTVRFDCTVGAGQCLYYDPFRGIAAVTDKNYNIIADAACMGELKFDGAVSPVSFSCSCMDDEKPEVSVRFVTRGEPEVIA